MLYITYRLQLLHLTLDIFSNLGYIGCFLINNTQHVYRVFQNYGDMTNTLCREYCRGLAALYAGSSGRDCFCFNNTDNLLPDNNTSCDTRCAGNPTQICGGKNFTSVYFIGTCFTSANNRFNADSALVSCLADSNHLRFHIRCSVSGCFHHFSYVSFTYYTDQICSKQKMYT